MITLPGWDALTFFATIALIIYAALDRHLPRRSDNNMSASTSPSMRVLFSRRQIISLGLGILFAIITFGLMLTRPSLVGPPGPQGSQGIPGPQGPPGYVDPVFAGTFKTLVELYNIEPDFTKLQDLRNSYKDAYNNHLASIQNFYPDQAGIGYGIGYRDPISSAVGAVERIQQQIKDIVKRDLHIEITFDAHPTFDRNPFYRSAEADKASTQFYQEEYRRFFDQYQTSEQVLDDVMGKLKQRIDGDRYNLSMFAQSNIGKD
jgi:hypothetical protein